MINIRIGGFDVLIDGDRCEYSMNDTDQTHLRCLYVWSILRVCRPAWNERIGVEVRRKEVNVGVALMGYGVLSYVKIGIRWLDMLVESQNSFG